MLASPVQAKSPEPENPSFSRQTQTSGKPTILIVEDHEDTREMLRMLFKMWGCRVVEARNGLEAVEAASRERPALILMDISLPFLDGLGATRRIRENKVLSEVKIVALNGWGTLSYTADALAAGCDDCLVKPLDFARLGDHLNNLRSAWDSSRVPVDLSLIKIREIGGRALNGTVSRFEASQATI